jgi:translation initiation factor IF-2
MRRENEIGRGHIRELQSQKIKTSVVNEGTECGLMLEAKIEVAPGDKLESCRMIEK